MLIGFGSLLLVSDKIFFSASQLLIGNKSLELVLSFGKPLSTLFEICAERFRIIFHRLAPGSVHFKPVSLPLPTYLGYIRIATHLRVIIPGARAQWVLSIFLETIPIQGELAIT